MDRVIKVLHVFGKMGRGGAETRTLEVMPLLREKGVTFDFCTLTAEKGLLDEKIEKLGGIIRPCPLRPNVLTFGRRFVRLLKNSDYDIVHSHGHNFSGYIVRLAYKAGVEGRIVHFRSISDGKDDTIQRRVYKWVMRRFIDKYATSILAVCRGAMEYGWRKDWAKDQRCEVIYNGIDMSVYNSVGNERKSVTDELGIPIQSKLAVNVGSIRKPKAHDILINAIAYVIGKKPDVHLILVGDGILREQIENQVKAKGLSNKVHFLGMRSDVPRLLKASDCFVLSSRREGLPGVVLEALAAGLPIVATDLPGVREIAEHTDLISVVKVEDSEALAKGVLNAIEDINTKTHKHNPFPESFDLRRCSENLFNVYVNQLK